MRTKGSEVNVVLFQPGPLDLIRIMIGMIVLTYVSYCLMNQKVWIRKIFGWGTREEYPMIWLLNIVGGLLLAFWMIGGQIYRLI